MFPDEIIKPFYMMNADVFFDASVIAALEKDERNNLVVVDMGRYIEEVCVQAKKKRLNIP